MEAKGELTFNGKWWDGHEEEKQAIIKAIETLNGCSNTVTLHGYVGDVDGELASYNFMAYPEDNEVMGTSMLQGSATSVAVAVAESVGKEPAAFIEQMLDVFNKSEKAYNEAKKRYPGKEFSSLASARAAVEEVERDENAFSETSKVEDFSKNDIDSKDREKKLNNALKRAANKVSGELNGLPVLVVAGDIDGKDCRARGCLYRGLLPFYTKAGSIYEDAVVSFMVTEAIKMVEDNCPRLEPGTIARTYLAELDEEDEE